MYYDDSHKRRSPLVKIVGICSGILFAIAVCIFLATGARTIDTGKVGVFQYRPVFFGSGSVSGDVRMGPETVFLWPSTTLVEIQYTPQTMVIHAEDFVTSNQVPLDFDVSVTIYIPDPKQASLLYRDFGTGPKTTFSTLVLQENVVRGKKVYSGEFMSSLRDQVRLHNSSVFISASNPDGTHSDGAVAVERATRDRINAFLKERGAGMIQIANIALGKANPPEGVLAQIAETARQAQDSKTQAARLIAAQVRKSAEVAVAEADKAYRDSLGLTSHEYIEMKRLDAIREVCTKATCSFVNGQVPVALSAK